VRSLIEWGLAIAALAGVVSLGAPVVMPWLPRAQNRAALESDSADPPEGVPSSATSIPVLLLLDGSEVRVGDTDAHLATELPESALEPKTTATVSAGGRRVVRTYLVRGTRFWVVVERWDPKQPPRVTGIFLP
jgi:hypothetical protein